MMTLTSGYLIVIRGDVIIDRYGDTAALLRDRLRAAAVGVPKRQVAVAAAFLQMQHLNGEAPEYNVVPKFSRGHPSSLGFARRGRG